MLLPRDVHEDRTPNAVFLKKLKAFDSALVVYFNRFKGRWVIDRCVHGNACAHSGNCERVNAMIVQSPEGGYMPLGEHVFEELRKRDLWRQFDSAEHMGAVQSTQAEEQRDKIVADIRGDFNSMIREDRVQLNRFRHLIQTHDIGRPNR
jgi:hypothetical protein